MNREQAMDAIKITGLSKTYKGIKSSVTALDSLDLTVKEGEIFGFIGPNGAGKSTTIKILLNIIFPTSGSAVIKGEYVTNPGARKNVGYLPENPYYYDYLSVYELICFAGKIHNIPSDLLKARAYELIEKVGLTKARDMPLRKYSKGMLQRAGMAMSLIHDPSILILDEPASGLDPVGRRQLTDILLSLKQKGKTIFFSSHILHDVETICDRVGIIAKGKLSYEGSLSEIKIREQGLCEILIRTSNGTQEMIAKAGYVCHREGELRRISIPKKDLWQFLDLMRVSGAEIISIEQRCVNLEDIFLEKINAAG